MTPKNVVIKEEPSANDDNELQEVVADNEAIRKSNVLEGPDLNPHRTPFDKKEYKQILLPNGLRVVLVNDTIAMKQSFNDGGIDLYSDDEDEDESSTKKDNKRRDDDDDDMSVDGSSASSNEDDDDDDEGGGDAGGGLRNAACAMVVGVGSYSDPPECQGLAHFLEHLLFMGSKKYPKENAFDEFMSEHGGSDNAYTELEHTTYHFDIPQEHLKQALDMFAQFFISPLMSETSVDRELKSIESEFQLVKNNDN